MEENKKNNSKALLIIIAILVVIIVAGIVGFIFYTNSTKNSVEANSSESTSDNQNNEETSKDEDKKETSSNSSSTDAKTSSAESPAKLNEWSLVSKRVSKHLSESYENTEYVDIPARITKVTRGSEAETLVKNWFNNQTMYKYEDPKAYTEWAVFDYEVDLSSLTFDEGSIGTSTYINSNVTGVNGSGGVKYNDISYILSTKDISDRDYGKEPKIYKCQFICTLPEGCTDYLVKLGDSYNGTLSYIKPE